MLPWRLPLVVETHIRRASHFIHIFRKLIHVSKFQSLLANSAENIRLAINKHNRLGYHIYT